MRQRTTGICDKTDTCRGHFFFLFRHAGPGYFREVPMNRFSTAVSGAQLSEKVTLKHAHSSGFAHPTATFDPSIHISIERPTHCCQKTPNPPRVGHLNLPTPEKFRQNRPTLAAAAISSVHRGGIWRFMAAP